MAARQGTLKGIVPPLTAVQEAALLYVEAKEESDRARDRANDRKDDMLKSAVKAKVDMIKVRSANGDLFIFDLTNEIKVKQTKMKDIKIEKAEEEPAAAR
jgi:hypothetical protein